jgi:WD40 repeat protein
MPDGTTPPCDLFVCYAEPDRGWVEHDLVEGLRAAGVRCSTAAAFRPGASRLAEFERAVAESPRVLLVLSAAGRTDVDQRFFDDLARYHELENQTESVIPLLLDEGPAPLGVRAKVSLRAMTDEEKAEAVERLANLCRSGPASAPTVPRCPYPGLAPFERDDSAWFHGRRREVDELSQVLEHRNCLFLIGRSGSGKSSLVLAGLLPRLEEGRTVRVMRPGAAPRAALEALDWGGAGRRLLVVDQFEELYTQAPPEEAAALQRALCDWVADPARMLLVTVRADFYADLQASAIFPLFQANHRDVLPPGREALREAIVKPAASAGVFVEPALVERLLADAAGEPGVLPLLQETMRWLWGKLRRRYLPVEAYDELGRDGRTGLQEAMAVIADAAVDGLPLAEQALARRTLVRLVQFGEGRQDTRRSQPLSDLESAGDPPGALSHVLGRLILRRLIVAGSVRAGAGETTVIELAHEALITGWPRLRDWVREGREAEQVRRRLEEHAAEWVRLGRGGGGLIDEVRLPAAEEWLARHAAERGASAELRALIAASRAKVDADRAAARRRRRIARAAMALSLLAAAALAVWGVVSADDARRAAHLVAANQTQTAWEEGDVDSALTLLERQRPRPAFFWEPDLRGFEWYHYWRLCHRDRCTFTGHDYEVWAVGFDDQSVVSATGEWKQTVLQVGRWEADGARPARGAVEPLPAALVETEVVTAIAVSPDGRTMAVAAFGKERKEDAKERGVVTVWDLTTRGKVAPGIRDTFDCRVKCLAFSPDGGLLAAGGRGCNAVWETKAYGRTFDKPLPPDAAALALAFDGTGLLAMAFEVEKHGQVKDSAVRLFGPAKEKDDRHGGFTVPGKITCLAFSPSHDGRRTLAVGTDKGTVHIWGFADQPQKQPDTPPPNLLPAPVAGITCLAFSPTDGSLLAVGSEDHTIRLLRLTEAGGAEVQDDTFKHSRAVKSLAFRRDGRLLASGGEDRKVKLWDVPADSVWERPRQWHRKVVRSLAFSNADGTQLVTGGADLEDRQVVLWDAATGIPTRRLWEHGKDVKTVAFAPDGRRVASASADGEIIFGSVSAPADRSSVIVPADPLPPRKRNVLALAFAPGGKLAAGTEGGMIHLFRPEGRSLVPVGSLEKPRDAPIYGLAWSPDGRALVSAGGRASVIFWDPDLGNPRRLPLPESAHEVWCLAFSPDGRTLATGSGDSMVRLWDVKSLELRRVLPGPGEGTRHSKFVYGLAYSPDGKTLASAGEDGTVILWDAEGRARARFREAGKFWGVAFAPADGRGVSRLSPVLAAARDDGSVRFWRAATEPDPPPAP